MHLSAISTLLACVPSIGELLRQSAFYRPSIIHIPILGI
jgi:hypothetical protein